MDDIIKSELAFLDTKKPRRSFVSIFNSVVCGGLEAVLGQERASDFLTHLICVSHADIQDLIKEYSDLGKMSEKELRTSLIKLVNNAYHMARNQSSTQDNDQVAQTIKFKKLLLTTSDDLPEAIPA